MPEIASHVSVMASAALAQSSYRIAKSWQYQEKLPNASSENLSIADTKPKLSKSYNNIQGYHLQPNSFQYFLNLVLFIFSYIVNRITKCI